MKNAIQLLTIGLASAVLAALLEIPAGWMIGPMLAVSMLKIAGLDLDKAPRAYSEVGKVLLGTFIGATFNRQALGQLGHLLPPAIAAMLAMIGIGLALAWMLHRFTRLDIATALFSLTPGGMPEMVAVAQEAGADLGIVAALQFLRHNSVVILAPVIIAWFFC